MAESALNIKAVAYRWTETEPWSLKIGELILSRGEHLFISGPSGSGKSTLLNLISGILIPNRGSIEVLGQPLADLSGPSRDRFRADNIGFIFQMFNLVPYLNVLENILLPCRFSNSRLKRILGASSPEFEARRLLTHMGLDPVRYGSQPVTELSVGQQQRVAAARALMGAPGLIIADEPTSALDTEAQIKFLDLLSQETTKSKATLILVSHDQRLAPYFSSTLAIPAAEENR
ncbi:MAG: methionine ABC transporter ATP-binding protein [Rhodospirillaceae bacterium TMED8]|nr:methionine ABC transporter ATP-binding protein [Magnetovibrio sp.]OUT48581.1 MAG: methionine ABC transporter ATP-binding protein [Rhodospirillaceae bacterium TMED8]